VCFPVPGGVHIGNVTATSIQILWTDTTPGETRFEINRQPVGGNATTVIVPANTTSFTDSGLSAGASIDYRVRACDGLGCSDWSIVAHGRTGAKLTVSMMGLTIIHAGHGGFAHAMVVVATRCIRDHRS
jgi:hypothetical protein